LRAASRLGGLALVCALVACKSTQPMPGGPADRLVVARSTDAVSLDPARTNDLESLEVAEQVYGRLVRFSPGRLEPEPDLATSWSVSADGTVWTFELRPNMHFQDGTPVDAEAVVFSFERQIVPEHPHHEPDFVWTRAYHNIRRVRADGPLRVQFEIDRPYAPFLANLAMGPAAIVSPTAVKRWGHDFGRHPVGSGPYRFVEWIPGDRITLERNPTYWDQPARTRYLVLLAMPDSKQRLQALESGAADVIQQLAPDDLPLVRLHPDLRLAMAPAALVSYLAMNTQRRPLNDPRIRRAIAHAIRTEALVKLVYQGLGIPAIGPLPPNVWGARSDVVTYPYNPAKARALLAEAGWQGDREAPLKLFAP
jgi:peptide/nickel transport system substrate-binding protein